MANGWTLERRKRQSMLIAGWNPSSKSTGPRTALGKSRSSLNALKHGGRTMLNQDSMALFKKIFQVQISILVQVGEKNNV